MKIQTIKKKKMLYSFNHYLHICTFQVLNWGSSRTLIIICVMITIGRRENCTLYYYLIRVVNLIIIIIIRKNIIWCIIIYFLTQYIICFFKKLVIRKSLRFGNNLSCINFNVEYLGRYCFFFLFDFNTCLQKSGCKSLRESKNVK